MPLVDAARLLSLAKGLVENSTVQRFQALVSACAVDGNEARGWIDAFNFLQSLRLRVQHLGDSTSKFDHNPNLIQVDSLSPLDRRILTEAMRQVRKAQQRLALDYP